MELESIRHLSGDGGIEMVAYRDGVIYDEENSCYFPTWWNALVTHLLIQILKFSQYKNTFKLIKNPKSLVNCNVMYFFYHVTFISFCILRHSFPWKLQQNLSGWRGSRIKVDCETKILSLQHCRKSSIKICSSKIVCNRKLSYFNPSLFYFTPLSSRQFRKLPFLLKRGWNYAVGCWLLPQKGRYIKC